MKVKDKVNSNNDTLLRTLFNYIVPFFNKNYSDNFKKNLKENNLESKLRSKKIKFDDILILEQLILSNIKKSNIKIKKEIKPENLDFFNPFLNENSIECKINESLKNSKGIFGAQKILKEFSSEMEYSLEIINKQEEIE